MALPSGLTSSGLPCSLQLIGARGHTDALVRVALAVENLSQVSTLKPQL